MLAAEVETGVVVELEETGVVIGVEDAGVVAALVGLVVEAWAVEEW